MGYRQWVILMILKFLGKTPNGCRLFVVHHKVRGAFISRTVWHRITKSYTHIQMNPLFSLTGYDVTSSFGGKLIWKMPPPITSDRISPERFKRGSQNFTHLSGTINLINTPDITSLVLVGYKMQKNTAQKGVNGSARQNNRIIRPPFNLETPNVTRTSTTT